MFCNRSLMKNAGNLRAIVMSTFQSASTTFNRDESPHGIDHLGVVVALYLIQRGDSQTIR